MSRVPKRKMKRKSLNCAFIRRIEILNLNRSYSIKMMAGLRPIPSSKAQTRLDQSQTILDQLALI